MDSSTADLLRRACSVMQKYDPQGRTSVPTTSLSNILDELGLQYGSEGASLIMAHCQSAGDGFVSYEPMLRTLGSPSKGPRGSICAPEPVDDETYWSQSAEDIRKLYRSWDCNMLSNEHFAQKLQGLLGGRINILSADSEFHRLTNQHRFARNLKFGQLMSALRSDLKTQTQVRLVHGGGLAPPCAFRPDPIGVQEEQFGSAPPSLETGSNASPELLAAGGGTDMPGRILTGRKHFDRHYTTSAPGTPGTALSSPYGWQSSIESRCFPREEAVKSLSSTAICEQPPGGNSGPGTAMLDSEGDSQLRQPGGYPSAVPPMPLGGGEGPAFRGSDSGIPSLFGSAPIAAQGHPAPPTQEGSDYSHTQGPMPWPMDQSSAAAAMSPTHGQLVQGGAAQRPYGRTSPEEFPLDQRRVSWEGGVPDHPPSPSASQTSTMDPDEGRRQFGKRNDQGHGNILTWGSDSRSITPMKKRGGRQVAYDAQLGVPRSYVGSDIFSPNSSQNFGAR